MTINRENEEALYRFIWKIVSDKKCKLLRIGGIENHVHIFVDIHPLISIASLIGEIKRQSSIWMRSSNLFPEFEGWGREYFVFSKSLSDKNVVIEYIKNQKNHHAAFTFEDEIKGMVIQEGGVWEDSLYS
ncbi:MAG: transposase [Muribaculaceae bacterium]|nr:transposase [Muribaculaceae bacterium]